MDTEAYRLRKKHTVAELARLLGVKDAAIYNYKYGKSKPSYESIEKMLLDGALISEIFNEEVQKKVLESIELHNRAALESVIPSDVWKDSEFLENFRIAYEDMKSKGLIK